MAPAGEALYRAPGPDGPAGSSSGPNGSLDALGENALKIILLGDSACGKSKLVERFLLNNYQSRQLSTYALTLFRHNATVDGQKVEIDFWDTAGQERAPPLALGLTPRVWGGGLAPHFRPSGLGCW
jgi:GTPase SAR1 family protein